MADIPRLISAVSQVHDITTITLIQSVTSTPQIQGIAAFETHISGNREYSTSTRAAADKAQVQEIGQLCNPRFHHLCSCISAVTVL